MADSHSSLLSIEIAGVRFNNPVLTASGTCGYGLDMAGLIDLNKLGGICTQGLSAEPMRGYDTRVIPNVFGYRVEEYIEAIEILEDGDGIHGYELNISCPNVKAGGESFANDARQAAAVTEAVKRAATRPVIVKLSPNVTDVAAIARAVEAAGADALSLVNTAVGMAIDVNTRRPRLANVTGGLSGPAIKPIAVRCVFQASRAVKIPLIGIGGIATTEDALEFIIAGASAIQVGTANFYDPAASMKIVDGLTEYCLRNGLENIGALVGTVVTEPVVTEQ